MTLRRQLLLIVLFVLTVFNVLTCLRPKLNKSLPKPSPVATDVARSFHVNGHKDAWILGIKDETVFVQTVVDKTEIHFRPLPQHLHRFPLGNIAAVTFECGRKPEEKCDLSKPYKLYVNNVQVELLEIRNKKTVK